MMTSAEVSGGGGGAITLVGSSSAVRASAPSLSLTRPVGVQAGDLIVLAVHTDTPRTMSASGFTVAAALSSTTNSCYVFTKVATGSEPTSYSVNLGGSYEYGAGVCAVYRGASAVVTVGMRSTTTTAPSITPTTPGVLLGVFTAESSSSAELLTFSPPSGMNTVNSALAQYSQLAVAEKNPQAAVATGSKTCELYAVAAGASFLMQIA